MQSCECSYCVVRGLLLSHVPPGFRVSPAFLPRLTRVAGRGTHARPPPVDRPRHGCRGSSSRSLQAANPLGVDRPDAASPNTTGPRGGRVGTVPDRMGVAPVSAAALRARTVRPAAYARGRLGSPVVTSASRMMLAQFLLSASAAPRSAHTAGGNRSSPRGAVGSGATFLEPSGGWG